MPEPPDTARPAGEKTQPPTVQLPGDAHDGPHGTLALPAAAPGSPHVTVDFQLDSDSGPKVPLATPIEGEQDEVVPFGDYELLGELGRGGMGIVYRARERHSGRMLALKMMLNEQAPRPSELRRFRLEARATSQLNHPGIVTIHAWGEHEGHLFYTMDLVLGLPLNRLLEQGPLPPERAVRYLVGMARAVAVAHAHGIIHRDLKPNNVIIAPNDEPCILDFGLAKHRRPASNETASSDSISIAEVIPVNAETMPGAKTLPPPVVGTSATKATEQGAILGTPSYMAPEQARGEHHRVSPATDVHALGCILHEMLVGRPPFQGGSVAETLRQVREREPVSMWVEGRRVPRILEAVCRCCLQKNPLARYADAATLADDLEERWQRARQGPRFAGLALVAGLAGLLLVGLRLRLAERGLTPLAVTESLMMQNAPVSDEVFRLLALLTDGIVFFGGSILALLAALMALAAWAWRVERGWIVGVVALGLLIGAGVLLFGTGQSAAHVGLAMFFLIAALLSSVIALGNPLARAQRTSAEYATKTEPFLQRLFVARGEAKPRKGQPITAIATVGMTDIELGKVLHRWDGGQIQRARQRSLDRAVLVWRDTTPMPAGAPMPGVLVRHPNVLSLHAVGVGSDGLFLVTEFAAATPLVDFAERGTLQLGDSVRLAANVARAVQAIHDQGACLGSLRPEWIMLRGDMEPLLCPWCVPSQSAEDRTRDSIALGRLLLTWLPPRSLLWQRRPFAAVYELADAASQGRYDRLADFADDLDTALQIVSFRRHEDRIAWLFVVLTVLPWLCLTVAMIASDSGQRTGGLGPHLLLCLVPAGVLLGYAQARAVVRRVRLRHSAQRSVLRWSDVSRFLAQLAVLIVPAGLFYWDGHGGWRVAGLLVGYWLLGACLAGLVTIGRRLLRSFQPLVTNRERDSDA